MLSIARTRAFTFFALAFLVFPCLAQGQQRDIGQLIADINDALGQNPTERGLYELSILPEGTLAAQRTDANGVVQRWEIHFEDIASVAQTLRGHLFLVCDETLGDCAKETCFGDYENFVGCSRASEETVRRLSDVLVLEYAYDTRAYRRLRSAFDELLQYDLEAISAHARSGPR